MKAPTFYRLEELKVTEFHTTDPTYEPTVQFLNSLMRAANKLRLLEYDDFVFYRCTHDEKYKPKFALYLTWEHYRLFQFATSEAPGPDPYIEELFDDRIYLVTDPKGEGLVSFYNQMRR